MTIPPLAIEMHRRLSADWFVVLAERHGLTTQPRGSTEAGYTFGPVGDQVAATFISAKPFIRFASTNATRAELVAELASQAIAKAGARDYGGRIWYSTTLEESRPVGQPREMLSALLKHLARTKIEGWRRLGTEVLLEFREAVPVNPAPGASTLPYALVDVHLVVPGPTAGFFTERLVATTLDIVASICSFAIARPLNIFPLLVPTKQENIAPLNARQFDAAILTLARRGVGLDFLARTASPGGLQISQRIASALFTIESAARQEDSAVACILYVAAAEGLSTPSAPWKLRRVIKRFVTFFETLIPEALDEIAGHANFESVFGFQSNRYSGSKLRREILEAIYTYRSGRVHEGVSPSHESLMGTGDAAAIVRASIFADFAEAAALAYLQAPRSSLIGSEPVCPECNGSGIRVQFSE